MSAVVDERAGVDDALVWRLYLTEATSPEAVVAEARALDEDAMLMADYVDEEVQRALHEAGFRCHYSAFDFAYLIFGPAQMERGRRYRQEAYRIVGRPA